MGSDRIAPNREGCNYDPKLGRKLAIDPALELKMAAIAETVRKVTQMKIVESLPVPP